MRKLGEEKNEIREKYSLQGFDKNIKMVTVTAICSDVFVSHMMIIISTKWGRKLVPALSWG